MFSSILTRDLKLWYFLQENNLAVEKLFKSNRNNISVFNNLLSILKVANRLTSFKQLLLGEYTIQDTTAVHFETKPEWSPKKTQIHNQVLLNNT